MRILSVLVFVFLALPAFAEAVTGRITVTGQGVIQATPDMATISVGVTREGRVAKEALAAMSTITQGIFQQLEAAGIASRDMQTSSLNLHPQYAARNQTDYEAPKIVGFVASNIVTVRVRNLVDLGDILDAVANSGANEFRGLQFGLQYPEPLDDQARVAAVKDAMARAKLYAGAAGVSLGQIMSISEAGAMPPGMPMEAMSFARDAGGVPMAAGEMDVRAEVTMVFEIAG